jgi:hypothetical protein
MENNGFRDKEKNQVSGLRYLFSLRPGLLLINKRII